MEGLNRNEAVFVDRVAMVEITNDQAVNQLVFRKHSEQHARLAHRREGFVGVRQRENFGQHRPKRASGAGLPADCRQRLFDSPLRFDRKRYPMPGDKGEQVQRQLRLGRQGLAAAQIEAAAPHDKVGIGQAGLAVTEKSE